MSIKNTVSNHVKNVSGWKSKRKLLSFAVDDYGNIRLANSGALKKLDDAGVDLKSRFDKVDALDTKKDYELLFKTLNSVNDGNGRPAVFTTYAMSSNVDFKQSLKTGTYVSENLDDTYARLSAENREFQGAFDLMMEGVTKGVIRPQFHGREHLNLGLFNNLLSKKDPVLMANLEQESLSGAIFDADYPQVKFSEAFSFWKKEETEAHKEIIKDGLIQFEKVYGYRPTTFTPPALLLHPELYGFVESLGLKSIDKPRSHRVHLGEGNYRPEKNSLGRKKDQNHITIVRNCMFEPNSRKIDWVNFTFNQIKAAFFWGKPAIVSSHRVNFCGLISPENREKGLDALKALLQKVVKTWPEVEFVSVDQLVDIMNNEA